ncbi:MAG: DUF4123 domain-containing protein [Pseudomonadota bacterium]
MFALIDLATAVDLRTTVTQLLPPQGRSLLEESVYADTVPVGPWLVDLRLSPDVNALWLNRRPESNWGYAFDSDLRFDQLRRHFRKFSLVALDGRKDPVFFRYFDPVVLSGFLSDWGEPEQTANFLEPLRNLQR